MDRVGRCKWILMNDDTSTTGGSTYTTFDVGTENSTVSVGGDTYKGITREEAQWIATKPKREPKHHLTRKQKAETERRMKEVAERRENVKEWFRKEREREKEEMATLQQQDEFKFKDVGVERTQSGKIQLPEEMELKEAIFWLTQKKEEEEKQVGVNETIEGFPLDVAYALQTAVKELYGFSELRSIPGNLFSPSKPPMFIKVAIDHKGNTEEVFWGRFSIPGTTGWLQTVPVENDAMVLTGQVLRKDLPQVTRLLQHTKKVLKEHSLYKGKAIRVHTQVEQNFMGQTETIAQPTFIDIEKIPAEIMLNRETEELLNAAVWTPIERTAQCRHYGIPLRRGVLLSGPYGTGKSLFALETARRCTQNGWTFVYLKDIRELKKMYYFAARYAPAVLFGEDLDIAITEHPGESEALDINELQNVLDGVDTKNQEVMIVLTSNHIDKVPPVLLRPGRIDTAAFFEPPDKETSKRLIAQFGGDQLEANFDFNKAGEACKDQIPATIREILERAKRFTLSRVGPNHTDGLKLSALDVVRAANSMRRHLDYLNRPRLEKPSWSEQFGEVVGGYIARGIEAAGNGNNGLSVSDDLEDEITRRDH